MIEPSGKDQHEPPTPQPANPTTVASQPEGAPLIVPFDDFLVDEAGMETFPASDPPSWTPLITMGHPHQRVEPAEPIPNPDETPPSSP